MVILSSAVSRLAKGSDKPRQKWDKAFVSVRNPNPAMARPSVRRHTVIP